MTAGEDDPFQTVGTVMDGNQHWACNGAPVPQIICTSYRGYVRATVAPITYIANTARTNECKLISKYKILTLQFLIHFYWFGRLLLKSFA